MLGFMETFSLQQLNQQLCPFAEEVNEFSHLGPGPATCAVGPVLDEWEGTLWGPGQAHGVHMGLRVA